MPNTQIIIRTALALLAFAGNSLLCRQALKATALDAASFTTIRLVSAAVSLAMLVLVTRRTVPRKGDWPSGLALFAYAAAFSLAYVQLSAGTGALLLFGAVQLTMIGYGLLRGERLVALQVLGLALACAGLVGLVLPGLSAPPLASSAMMLAAGVAWGAYSLRGRGAGDPLGATAGNFLRTVPMTLVFSLIFLAGAKLDNLGVAYALASGVITSGLGYAVWYSVLPSLKATQAASLQLSVPVIAAAGAILLLGEQPSWRLAGASLAILLGIWLVIQNKAPAKAKA
ncbi:MAG: DMT family transporter [Alphaproteobacteria bacterium]|nr:DMT family transporter [Alphaproteobacteria bacterium]